MLCLFMCVVGECVENFIDIVARNFILILTLSMLWCHNDVIPTSSEHEAIVKEVKKFLDLPSASVNRAEEEEEEAEESASSNGAEGRLRERRKKSKKGN